MLSLLVAKQTLLGLDEKTKYIYSLVLQIFFYRKYFFISLSQSDPDIFQNIGQLTYIADLVMFIVMLYVTKKDVDSETLFVLEFLI